ncbi:MAG: class I SAM-dependent methyltransferase [Micrococcales bacterium]|nr:class I SAM-dependent methyltransferase [Micrococcales bacterium]
MARRRTPPGGPRGRPARDDTDEGKPFVSQEPDHRVSGDSALQTCTLESLTSAVNYHAWLTDLVRPHLGDDPLEVGSGLGDYARTWLDGGVPRLTLSDRDPGRFAHLQAEFADDPRVTVTDVDVLDPPHASYSSLVAVNVLEHIEDHVGALRSAHRLVRPGGTVVMFVPAFEFAMSRFDRAVGHHRRYTVRSLTAAYEEAGLRPESVRYVNAPGLFAWFVGMRLLRMTPTDGPTVRLWDRAVVPVARRVERRVRVPFGQSVLAVGRVDG